MKRLYLYIISFFTALALATFVSGCKESEPEVVTPNARTVLVYMVAANNLGQSGYDEADLREMRIAATKGDIGPNNRLIVYHHDYKEAPKLIEITAEGDVILAEYDPSANSVESKQMLLVLDDLERLAPALSYGIVLWSHGTGWIQDGMETESIDDQGKIMPQSFGYIDGNTMNTTTLARVLGSRLSWDFIYFDCCYMNSVETLYELRHVAPLIAGSVTELPSEGMPYNQNVAFFFSLTPDIVGAATNTFEHFDSYSGSDRTCTMSVIKTSALDELAASTREIYRLADGTLPDDYEPQLFMAKRPSSCYYFDFEDYVKVLCFDGPFQRFEGASALYARFEAALDDAVVYKASTPYLWNLVPLTRHCGMSTNILRTPASASGQGYNTLSWYDDVVSYLKFN